jgi:hypothetical protein
MTHSPLPNTPTPTRTLISGGQAQLNARNFHQETQISKANCEHINRLGDWTHSVTLTFKKFNPIDHGYTTDSDVLKSTKVFLNTLNTSIFGHGAIRKGYRIASVGTLGHGAYGGHPHVHLSLEMPTALDPNGFTDLIYTNAKKVTLINREIKVKPIYSTGWTYYMVSHGNDSIQYDLCHAAYPKG